MAKATTTIKQALHYGPEHSAWFAATQTLFNRVCAFYFAGIQAHSKILALTNKAEAKGKKFHECPPVPPRTWNKSVSLYAGMWKDRSDQSISLKTTNGRIG